MPHGCVKIPAVSYSGELPVGYLGDVATGTIPPPMVGRPELRNRLRCVPALAGGVGPVMTGRRGVAVLGGDRGALVASRIAPRPLASPPWSRSVAIHLGTLGIRVPSMVNRAACCVAPGRRCPLR